MINPATGSRRILPSFAPTIPVKAAIDESTLGTMVPGIRNDGLTVSSATDFQRKSEQKLLDRNGNNRRHQSQIRRRIIFLMKNNTKGRYTDIDAAHGQDIGEGVESIGNHGLVSAENAGGKLQPGQKNVKERTDSGAGGTLRTTQPH